MKKGKQFAKIASIIFKFQFLILFSVFFMDAFYAFKSRSSLSKHGPIPYEWEQIVFALIVITSSNENVLCSCCIRSIIQNKKNPFCIWKNRMKLKFLALIGNAHRCSGLSLRELAAICDRDPSYVSHIVSGERRPGRDVLIILCAFNWQIRLCWHFIQLLGLIGSPK